MVPFAFGRPPRLRRRFPGLGGVTLGQRTSVPHPKGPPTRLWSREQTYFVHRQIYRCPLTPHIRYPRPFCPFLSPSFSTGIVSPGEQRAGRISPAYHATMGGPPGYLRARAVGTPSTTTAAATRAFSGTPDSPTRGRTTLDAACNITQIVSALEPPSTAGKREVQVVSHTQSTSPRTPSSVSSAPCELMSVGPSNWTVTTNVSLRLSACG